jgi:predicted  nucleic acid-binding Zn-ribbon protein
MGKQMNPVVIGGLFELAKTGIKALIENIDFTSKNASSVNVEQRMNEMRGDMYALDGYLDKMKAELDEAKIMIINVERKACDFEARAVKAEMRADIAENKAKELQHELTNLQKYLFTGRVK